MTVSSRPILSYLLQYERTLVHEAGHAVVAHLLGDRLLRVAAIRSEGHLGDSFGEYWHLLPLALKGKSALEVAARISAAWQHAIIGASGAAAEALHDPYAGRSGVVRKAYADDRNYSSLIFRNVGIQNPENEWRFRAARRVAREFLWRAGIWKAVVSLAGAIGSADGVLEGSEIDDVIETNVNRGDAVGALMTRIESLVMLETPLSNCRAAWSSDENIREVRGQLGIDRPEAIAHARSLLAKYPTFEAKRVREEMRKRFGSSVKGPDISHLRPAGARGKVPEGR